MPSRIIREGINDSKAINQLSDSAEIFFRRLMSVVDDFGRYEADFTLLRAKLFGFKLDDWPEDRIGRALQECSTRINGGDEPLVLLYACGKKKLLQVSNFGQRRRTSKYAGPGELPMNQRNGATNAGKAPEPAADTVPVVVAPAVPAVELATTDHFEEFWSSFWRKDGKKAARVKFASKVKSADIWERVKLAVQKQRSKMLDREEEHRPQAASWLSEERWTDEESPQRETKTEPKNADERNQRRRDDLNQGLKILRKKRV